MTSLLVWPALTNSSLKLQLTDEVNKTPQCPSLQQRPIVKCSGEALHAPGCQVKQRGQWAVPNLQVKPRLTGKELYSGNSLTSRGTHISEHQEHQLLKGQKHNLCRALSTDTYPGPLKAQILIALEHLPHLFLSFAQTYHTHHLQARKMKL